MRAVKARDILERGEDVFGWISSDFNFEGEIPDYLYAQDKSYVFLNSVWTEKNGIEIGEDVPFTIEIKHANNAYHCHLNVESIMIDVYFTPAHIEPNLTNVYVAKKEGKNVGYLIFSK